jgi:hypothetical protein
LALIKWFVKCFDFVKFLYIRLTPAQFKIIHAKTHSWTSTESSPHTNVPILELFCTQVEKGNKAGLNIPLKYGAHWLSCFLDLSPRKPYGPANIGSTSHFLTLLGIGITKT